MTTISMSSLLCPTGQPHPQALQRGKFQSIPLVGGLLVFYDLPRGPMHEKRGFSFISFTFPHTSPSAWDIVAFSEYWFGKMRKANVKQSHRDGDLAEDVTSLGSRTSTLLPHHSKDAGTLECSDPPNAPRRCRDPPLPPRSDTETPECSAAM